jgi:hypothetical protein
MKHEAGEARSKRRHQERRGHIGTTLWKMNQNLGDSETRRLGDSASDGLGSLISRRLGSSTAWRLSDSGHRRLGDSVAQQHIGLRATRKYEAGQRTRAHSLVSLSPRIASPFMPHSYALYPDDSRVMVTHPLCSLYAIGPCPLVTCDVTWSVPSIYRQGP